jgi:hypothetical protein
VYFAVFFKNFLSVAVILDLLSSFSVQDSLPYSKVGTAAVLHILNFVWFWTSEGFRTLVTIPLNRKNLVILIRTLCRQNSE